MNTPETPAPRALTILLVDDDELMIETLGWLLQSLGHQVETASHGQEAIEKLKAGFSADVVLMDQQMPGLTGVETLAQLRPLWPQLPVLLASGTHDRALEESLAAYLPARLLKKPLQLPTLREALASLPRPLRDPA